MNIKREFILSKNNLPLYDITNFTAIDYPNHLATIFWFAGCNMRCDYCYNKSIVFGEAKISQKKAIDFLKTRVNLLEGVVLSGGECTQNSSIFEFCQEIKSLGFKIKIDTNGTNPKILRKLIKNSLVDFISLDYKAPKNRFLKITKNRDFEQFSKTLKYLIKKEFDFEVRTTIHTGLLNEDDINKIIKDLSKNGYRGDYYLQSFIYDKETIGKMQKEKREIDRDKISKDITIIYRDNL